MASKESYSQILERLEPPPDLEKVITCKLCGGTMHWFLVNKQVGFWLHHGEDLQRCADRNPMMKGKPMIAQNMKFYRKIHDLWNEKVKGIAARQDTRKRQKLPKLQALHVQSYAPAKAQ